MREIKNRIITGVQPSGNFTLDNYIGATKNFVKLQKDYESYIFIADYSNKIQVDIFDKLIR